MSLFPLQTKELLEFLHSLPCLQRRRSVGAGDTYRGPWNGKDAIIKSYAETPQPFRWLIGRKALRNEAAIAQYLTQTKLVKTAEFCGWLHPEAAAFEFLPNQGHLEDPRHHPELPRLPLAFYQKLQEMILNLHAHKIAHGDLRRANILISPENSPILIDWASAINLNTRHSWLWRFFFRLERRQDLYRLGVILENDAPEIMAPEVRHAIEHPGLLIKLGHFYRRQIYHRLIRSKHK